MAASRDEVQAIVKATLLQADYDLWKSYEYPEDDDGEGWDELTDQVIAEVASK